MLAPAQARHLRDVLRLREGDSVEVFDDEGRTARGEVAAVTPDNVRLRVSDITTPGTSEFTWTIAAAVPKGPRADWMIEKLAELGTAAFIPLKTERSVTHPGGTEKIARWTRLATEAARQSGRAGVMKIDALTEVREVIAAGGANWYLSPDKEAGAIKDLLSSEPATTRKILIGPEGGWSREEITAFEQSGARAVRIARNTLRVETAAVAAAAIMAAWGIMDNG